ncbi:hypothetical protein H6G76_15370 [Nostoc sp. FACHB-152]|uniref:hypothetical protein n=1 Tax=unclassified Nostoc TaxID=2593658 RepID=UPI001685A187|nr:MULTISPECIES: hypothetical protein [unclassified Nostoc]MBD2448511.1 hypothetical protein [Nostoc sp. FACHB-152]MBD2466248.1 hypothetical protein [Nostoc sp. FACHB-145]
MFRLAIKSFTIGSLVAISTASSVFAQVPLIRNLDLVKTANFSCGPHLSTYIVKPLDNRQGFGIRCVKFSEGRPGTTIPKLAWYGEGNWGGATYRHVGQAIYRSSNLVGFASDIHGNGEDIHNNFPGNLKVEVIGSTIRVTGAWNEEWHLVRSTNYQPLSRPNTCGGYFDEYRVSDLAGSRRGSGLRCVLRVGPNNTTWFGNGNWGGSTYSHIGTRSFNGYGASDVCGTGFGPICNTFGWGSLKFTPVPGAFNVTGAWSEKWR